MQKKTKKTTLDTLATAMQAGFVKVHTDIESLARMTAKSFENTPTKDDFIDLKSDVQTLKSDVSGIKLRLNNLAPKFEVKELEKRVVRLEQKAGIRHSA